MGLRDFPQKWPKSSESGWHEKRGKTGDHAKATGFSIFYGMQMEMSYLYIYKIASISRAAISAACAHVHLS